MENTIAPVENLFNQRGWHLEQAILEADFVTSVRTFLETKHQHLQEMFFAWVGDAAETRKSYGWYQQQLPAYEERGLPKDLRHFLTGEFNLETRLDPMLMQLLSSERCKAFLGRFLNVDQYFIHYPPMVRFKVAEAGGSLVPVHQDSAYNQHLTDFITVWVPLVDIDEECGGIIVYEESQFTEHMTHERSGAWANKTVIDLSPYRAQHVLMNAGDALLFAPNLLHESAPHRSTRVRYSIDFRVFRDPSNSTKSYYDPDTNTIIRRD